MKIGIDIAAEIESNLLRELEILPPSVGHVVRSAHEALCSLKVGRIESALSRLKGLGPDQVGAIASRHIHAFECLLRAAYHTLLAEQMEQSI